MADSILKMKDLKRITGLSMGRVRYMISIGKLPKKDYEIGGWKQSEVDDYLQNRHIKSKVEVKEMFQNKEDYNLVVIGYNNLINAIEFIYQMFPECTNVHVVKRIGNNDMKNYDLYLNSLIGRTSFIRRAIIVENVVLERSLTLQQKADMVIQEAEDLSFYYSKRRGHVNLNSYYFEYYTAEGGAGEIGSYHLGGDYWKYVEVKKPLVDTFETILLEEFKQICRNEGISEEYLLTIEGNIFTHAETQLNWEWYKKGTESNTAMNDWKLKNSASIPNPYFRARGIIYGTNENFRNYPPANMHPDVANYNCNYGVNSYIPPCNKLEVVDLPMSKVVEIS